MTPVNTYDPTPRQCLNVMDALGLEAWQEGEFIFAIVPDSNGRELESFSADGHGLQAFLNTYKAQPATCAA